MSYEQVGHSCNENDKPFYARFLKSNVRPSEERMRRIVIMDGANLIASSKCSFPGVYYGKRTRDFKVWDSGILVQLAYFFDYYGFRVQICLRPDIFDYAQNPDVLRELVNLGYAFVSENKHKEDDDRAALKLAIECGAIIVTNDKFRNHHGYGFYYRQHLCEVETLNPERSKYEFPMYQFNKKIEEFYFERNDVYYQKAIAKNFAFSQSGVVRNKLRNLFLFLCSVGMYQLTGEFSTGFHPDAYNLPIDIRYLHSNDKYGERYTYFTPNSYDSHFKRTKK